MDYVFRLTRPDDRLTLSVVAKDAAGPVMVATLSARHQALSDGALARACLRFPFMTAKIILAIHWEALKLWLKGISFHRRPSPPAASITLGQPLVIEETSDKKVRHSVPA